MSRPILSPDGPKAELRPPRVAVASYREQSLAIYRGNPLIEALPPIRSQEEVILLLAHDIDFSASDREMSREERIHLTAHIPSFYEPLPMSLVLYERIERMLRLGYHGRNPLDASFPDRVDAVADSISDVPCSGRPRMRSGAFNSAISMSVVGTSGIGKTSAIQTVLDLFPQVIFHSAYRERVLPLKQVVWLKLDCPQDASLRGLLINLIGELDFLLGTTYRKTHLSLRPTVDELIPVVARLASWHGLGLLVIDEIQNLRRSKGGGENRLLNFFVQFINTGGVPVILVGTPQALPILTREFRMARRGTGQGDLLWTSMSDKGGYDDADDDSKKKNEEEAFRLFCEAFWTYQYVRSPVELSHDFLRALYTESAGITDIVVKLFVLAQQYAIDDVSERLTPDLIHRVAAEDLKLVRPALQALQQRDSIFLSRLDDVLLGPAYDAAFSEHALTRGHSKRENRIGTAGNVSRSSSSPHSRSPLPGQTATPSESAPEPRKSGKRPKTRDVARAGTKRLEKQSLAALVAAGHKEHRSAYDTLQACGFIRDLASEIKVTDGAAKAE